MKLSGIYKIQSVTKPERTYIGSAINITDRWVYHRRDLRANNHCNNKLQNHYNKYSESDFQFSVICECEENELVIKEQYYINLYNPYFNLCKVVEGRWMQSDESKQKNRQKHLGKKWTEEHRKKHSERMSGSNNPFFGKKHTIEAKSKIAKKLKGLSAGNKNPMYGIHLIGSLNPNYGKKISDETRKKLSDARKKNPNKRNGLGQFIKKVA